MTDAPTPAEPGPVDPDVELASAHLDGEAGADERADVDDPEVRSRLDVFATVADQVRDVPPPPPGLVDDHVARALAAFDEEARVVPLGGSRGSARPWWQRIPLGAVAAALVVVALISAIGLASTMDSSDDDTATAAFDDVGDSMESADDSMAGAAGGAAEEDRAFDTEAQIESAGERVAYDSVDELAEDLRARLSAGADGADAPDAESDLSTTTAGQGGDAAVDPCGAIALLGLDPADVVLVRSVVLTSDEVTVVVHDTADGRRLAVVQDASCDVIVDRPL